MFKQVWDTKLDTAYHENKEGDLGKIRFGADGSVYRWVRNESGATVSAGHVGFYGLADLTLGQLFILNQSGKTTSQALMAGVALVELQPNTGTLPKCYGWIQVGGYNPSIYMLSNTTALALGTSLIGLNDSFVPTFGAAAGTAPLYRRGIVSLEALVTTVTVATTRKGFISCFP